MKRQIIFGTMLSAAFAVGLAAQEPQPRQPPTEPTTPPPTTQPTTPRQEPQPSSPVGTSGVDQNASANQTVTLTGCVAANPMTGGAASPGAAGAGAGAQSAQGFILTNVSSGSGSSTGATAGTSGSTAGRTSTSGTSGTYRLTGDSSLQQYVGKRVEITGTVSSRADDRAAGATPGAREPGAATPPAGSMAGERSGNMPALKVTTVKAATGGASCPQ